MSDTPQKNIFFLKKNSVTKSSVSKCLYHFIKQKEKLHKPLLLSAPTFPCYYEILVPHF